jgi:hypothetical protein
MQSLFTKQGVWSGGFYEMILCLRERSSNGVSRALNEIWNSRALVGPFRSCDLEPVEQEVLQGIERELGLDSHLYGVAKFADGCEIPCGSWSLVSAGIVSCYIPMGALALRFSVGGFPFGDHHLASEWRSLVDEWFLNLLRGEAVKLQFEVGAIGFEPELDDDNIEQVRQSATSTVRHDGIVLPGDGEIRWFPPTHHDIITIR